MKQNNMLTIINTIRIKYIIIGILAFSPLGFSALGQIVGAKETKLVDLYVFEKYEDCLLRATKLTEKEKYKTQSEPYLWISLSLIACMEDDDIKEYYPKSSTVKKAVKAGIKFKKIDDKARSKNEDYLYDGNISLIYELMNLALVEGNVFLKVDNYSKASYYYKLATKLDPQNKECELLNGVLLLYNKNKEGQVIVDNAIAFFNTAASKGEYAPDSETESAFVNGFIYYSNYLLSKEKKDEAIKVMDLALKLDPQNTDFTKYRNEMGNK